MTACSVDVESEEDDEDMSVDATKQPAEIEQALGAANALGKVSTWKTGGSNLADIADGLDELNMDDYDDEDDGISLFNPFLSFSIIILILRCSDVAFDKQISQTHCPIRSMGAT